jgi:hypothetical protein
MLAVCSFRGGWIQQLDELFNAIQCVMQGKLPISLINPTVLQNILRNVSLHIPEGFELIAGIRTENIYLYYELVKISVAATPHCIELMINVPLKTANSFFTLYKIITLPEHVSTDNLFSTLLIILILVYTITIVTTSSVQKNNLSIAHKVALLYAQFPRQFITLK